MVQTTKPALTTTEGENRSERESEPDMSPAQSRLLRLPAEVRVMIYSLLFSDLRVTIARSAQLPNKGPWNLFLTCRKCCTEALPLFYQLATISVEPEAYVYVLRRKIGQQNMASLRSLSVRVNNRMGSETAALFPATLARLSIEWKSVMALFGTPSKSRLSDEDIHRTLDSRHRAFLTSCVMELWTKNPRLQIYLNVVVDQNSSPKIDPSLYTERYVFVRVEIVKDSSRQSWSWGEILQKGRRINGLDCNENRLLIFSDFFPTSLNS